MTRPRSEKIGVHEETDWFRYHPNNLDLVKGYEVQARWLNGSRVFRHRRELGGAWVPGAPWEK